jgi:hypothetical protein
VPPSRFWHAAFQFTGSDMPLSPSEPCSLTIIGCLSGLGLHDMQSQSGPANQNVRPPHRRQGVRDSKSSYAISIRRGPPGTLP